MNESEEKSAWQEKQLSDQFLRNTLQLAQMSIEAERDVGRFLVALNSGGILLLAAAQRQASALNIDSVRVAAIAFFVGVFSSFILVAVNAWRLSHARDAFGDAVLAYYNGNKAALAICNAPRDERWNPRFATAIVSLGVFSCFGFLVGGICIIVSLSK